MGHSFRCCGTLSRGPLQLHPASFGHFIWSLSIMDCNAKFLTGSTAPTKVRSTGQFPLPLNMAVSRHFSHIVWPLLHTTGFRITARLKKNAVTKPFNAFTLETKFSQQFSYQLIPTQGNTLGDPPPHPPLPHPNLIHLLPRTKSGHDQFLPLTLTLDTQGYKILLYFILDYILWELLRAYFTLWYADNGMLSLAVVTNLDMWFFV